MSIPARPLDPAALLVAVEGAGLEQLAVELELGAEHALVAACARGRRRPPGAVKPAGRDAISLQAVKPKRT